jgi:hypothetical protein
MANAIDSDFITTLPASSFQLSQPEERGLGWGLVSNRQLTAGSLMITTYVEGRPLSKAHAVRRIN